MVTLDGTTVILDGTGCIKSSKGGLEGFVRRFPGGHRWVSDGLFGRMRIFGHFCRFYGILANEMGFSFGTILGSILGT